MGSGASCRAQNRLYVRINVKARAAQRLNDVVKKKDRSLTKHEL